MHRIMVGMKRIYEAVIPEQFSQDQQMLFFVGPRQVGKTTISLTSQSLNSHFLYLNWDNLDDRELMLQGPKAIFERLNLQPFSDERGTVVFDELHKYKKWKNFLKGFYDTYDKHVDILVTGSAKLNIYRVGSDSLMGRYFSYRVHPISVAECVRTELIETEIAPPKEIEEEQWQRLLEFGGFPAPFLRADKRFATRWKSLAHEQLFRGDIRDLTNIQEINQLEILAELLKQQTGQLISYASLANKVRVSLDTVRRWVTVLNTFYYGFSIKPWTKNVSRSLLKNPKFYLWDWSRVADPGARLENFVAGHLLKAVHFWTDRGFGEFGLYFLRDKEQREVDFIVTKDKKPWFLVEVKSSKSAPLSESLRYYQEQLKVPHAFQVVFDLPFIDRDCFSVKEPMIVPAKTFFSQLI